MRTRCSRTSPGRHTSATARRRRHRQVFDAVIGGRDAAVEMLEQAHREGRTLEGWQLDKAARDYITRAGFGEYFNHRLGHSLGREVHSNAVNLGRLGDARHAPANPRRRGNCGAGHLPPRRVRRALGDRRVHGRHGTRVTTQMQRDVVLIDA